MKDLYSLESIKRDFERLGIKIKEPVNFKILQAKEKAEYILSQYVSDFKVLPEYAEIYSWLKDNEGRGLLLAGSCGRGKSLFGQLVIPIMLLRECNRVVNCVKAVDLGKVFDDISNRKIISVDDIGTERETNNYGTKRDYFVELIDKADSYGTLIIASTNLSPRQIAERYGQRTLDRIKGNMKIVVFSGESLRK